MKKFIKNVLENTYTEEDKLKMLQDVANKKVTPSELAGRYSKISKEKTSNKHWFT